MIQLKFKNGGKMDKYITYVYGEGSPFDTPNSFCTLFWGLALSPVIVPFSTIARSAVYLFDKAYNAQLEAARRTNVRKMAKIVAVFEANPKLMGACYYGISCCNMNNVLGYGYFEISEALRIICKKNEVSNDNELMIKLGLATADDDSTYYQWLEDNLKKYHDEYVVVVKPKKKFSFQFGAWISNAYHTFVKKTCPIVVWED